MAGGLGEFACVLFFFLFLELHNFFFLFFFLYLYIFVVLIDIDLASCGPHTKQIQPLLLFGSGIGCVPHLRLCVFIVIIY